MLQVCQAPKNMPKSEDRTTKHEASIVLTAPAGPGVQTVEEALAALLFMLHGRKEYKILFSGRIGEDS